MKPNAKFLIGCEFSGRVRSALRRRGFQAWSCDLLPAEDGSPFHIQGDVFDAINGDHWDVGIFFPSCRYLTVAGARWFKGREKEQAEAVEFVKRLAASKIYAKAIENPIGVLSTKWRKPDQIIQPWMFGCGETKATCLWLENLPKLVPTKIVDGREGRVWKEPPSPDRWKNRSRTYEGVAEAMAEQWGSAQWTASTEALAGGNVSPRPPLSRHPMWVGPDYPKAEGFRK